MSRGDAKWRNGATGAEYSCGYGKCSTGDTILQGTTLYHSYSSAAKKIMLDVDPNAPLLPTHNVPPVMFFSTVKERCAQFNGTIQTFNLKSNLPATYNGRLGGNEYVGDFFRANPDAVACFSDKECEVVIKTNMLDSYLVAPPGILSSIWYYLTCCCR